MRQEGQPVRLRLVIDAVVVLRERVAVDARRQHFHGDERGELVHVEQRAEFLHPFGGGRARGGGERLQIFLRRVVTALLIQPAVDVLRFALVEAAARAAKLALEKIFVHAFGEHVEAEVAAVALHAHMGRARRGDAGLAEQLRREHLAQVAGVLHGVVQHELAQAVVFLAGDDVVDLDGEGRLLVHRLKGAVALQAHAHVL